MASQAPTPIAIVGMACRLPGGSDTPDKLWEMLSEGRSGWKEIPADRWNKDSFYNPDPEAKEAINTKSLYFLDQDISAFDARFFNIHPHEAHCLDPQQRILMETTYEALEHAGQTLETIKGSNTSVHVGAYATDFERMGYKDTARIPKPHMIGTGIAILSNRISYVFDLKGPSSTVDTGCSGSMVALHQACLGLRAKESKMAIVAGTQLVLTPDQIIPMSSVGMTNPDGKCYVFDSRGAGYGRGEGVVSFILKRLDDAVHDGDKIHALIKNSGLNQDGKTAGISLPNSVAQANLMRQVYRGAGLNPRDTAYVEAHGTGTQAGDAAEISSIAEVFCEQRNREDSLYVGSIKSNIGHLEASSGVAGLLKGVLILKHGQIPPNIDFIQAKPTLRLEERNIKIATEMVSIPPADGPLRVSVNSFGYGGTNAHVILEAPPSAEHLSNFGATNGVNGSHNGSFDNAVPNDHTNGHTNGQSNGHDTHCVNGHLPGQENDLGSKSIPAKDVSKRSPQLFVLSARSESSLQTMITNLHNWVVKQTDTSYFPDLAYTLAKRRSKMQFRFSAAAGTHDELIKALCNKPRINKTITDFRSVFLFTGQGAQWHAMGRELIVSHPVFRKSMLNSDKLLRCFGADWSLIEELAKDQETSRVQQAEISQPSTTATQIALVGLLKTYGILPEIVLGHSSGEIAAAYAAGALTQAAALEISYRRGFMSKACAHVISTKGAMMAVGLGEHDAQDYIDQARGGLITVACINSPTSVTISGDEAAIDDLGRILDGESIFNRKLKVDTAYHSHHMRKVANDYLRSIEHIQAQTPNADIKFYSSVTVTRKTEGFDAQYWVDNLVSPVRFGNALELIVCTELAGSNDNGTVPLNLLTEIGPHSALAGPVRQTIKSLKLDSLKSEYLPTLARGRDAAICLLETAGKFFEFGYPVVIEGSLCIGENEATQKLIDDLAPYPWDHSTTFWYESRLSQEHRFRAHPPHDLLGLRVVGTTLHEPTWRHFLGIDSLPWLQEHVVDGFAIYPAAGYLCMAIEAVRQISIDRGFHGAMSQIHLKNVTFSKAIIIPERRPDGLIPDVEVLLTLKPAKHLTDRAWETFRITALSPEGVWHEHCAGSIMVDWASKGDEVEGLREQELSTASLLEQLEHIKDACDTAYGGVELYKEFTKNGNVYGPVFSGIQSVQLGTDAGVSEVAITDVASVMPRNHQQPHLIHPASFDALFQLGIPLYRRKIGSGPVMPTVLEDVTINCDIGSDPGTKWTTTTTMTETGFRFAVVDIVVYEKTEGHPLRPVIEIRGGSLRGVGEASQDDATLPFSRKMSYRLNWQPDVDFARITEPCTAKSARPSTPAPDVTASHEIAAAVYIQKCLQDIGTENDAHSEKLRKWFDNYSTKTGQSLLEGTAEVEYASCLQQSSAADITGRMLARIGENLHHILQDNAEPLPIFNTDGFLEEFYATGSVVPASTQLSQYLNLLAFKQPHMTVLEVGTGSSAVSLPVLRSFDRPEGFLCDRYCCTDNDLESLQHAKTLLQKWSDRIDFKSLDLSKDPMNQGFKEATYDLVIISNVFRQLGDLDQTVANLGRLLKSGGRLVLLQWTKPTVSLDFILNGLPGSSNGGDDRFFACSNDHLVSTLQRQGFKDVAITTVKDSEVLAESRIVISQNNETRTTGRPTEIAANLILNSPSEELRLAAQALLEELSSQGYSCSTVEDWPSRAIDLDALYIVLDDAAKPALASPSMDEFKQIVLLVTTAKKLIWIGCQGSDVSPLSPVKGLVNGLARVVRRENAGVRFITVDVQQSVSDAKSLIPTLSHVIDRSFTGPQDAPSALENEYIFSNNQLLIPRVHADAKFNDWVETALYAQKLQTGLFQQPDRPLRLEVETPGLLSSLRFVDDEVSAQLLDPFELELEARAYGINFKDVFIAMGQMIPGVTMTGECAGIVRRVGSGLAEKFRVGDRVCGFGAQPFSSYPRIDGNFSYQIPDSMAFEVGASIPIIFSTAYHCIVEVARLRRGQTILIHAASGGVGQAAIQLAQNIGAEIFCTVGSSTKRQLLIDHFGIAPSHIFSSRLQTFKQGILRLTGNKGVDCVLNSLSGESLHASFAVLAPLGTFVEIGKSDIYRKNEISMVPFDRNVTFAAVDLTVLAQLKPAEMRERLGKILAMFEVGVLGAVKPITTMPMTQIEDAFRLIQSRKHTGKVVLTCDKGTQVKLTLARPPPLQLARDSSYVVAGGLGDLGRRIAKFLAEHGAGHVVTLSRRSIADRDLLAFQKELHVLGAELHVVCCDVTDKESVKSAAAQCSESLPPVRGIVHAGMVLRDHPLELMSHEDYMTSIGPKVQGTLNLDEAFGEVNPLDFFIMLSSITAILGTAGQANYAVGNAFQDAFAQSRSAAKCKYIALNLGAVDGSLAITSLPAAQQEKMRQGSVLMSFDEVFKVLEYSMSSQATKDGLHQLILGFDRRSMETVHDDFALANPMFSQIPYLDGNADVKEDATTDIGKLLQQATTPEAVQTIVTAGICQRFAMFTGRATEEISPDVSMGDFGLDSLVAIELKNWLVRSFQTALQTSEVLDAPNIATLARTIASRSKLVSKDIQASKSDSVEVEEIPRPTENALSVANHNFHCCRASKELPKMPLVEFEIMFQNYLQNSRMFFTPDEFETLERDVADFRSSGSIGRKFYERLYQQAHDPEIENWQDRYFLQSMYLQRRMPLAPFNNFMAFHPMGEMGHTQAERAALIASIAFQCKRDLEADRWEPMAYLGTPNCTDLWQYIFNTARLPGVPLDRLAQFPSNDYLAAMHRGHIFKIDLRNGDEPVSLETLTQIFQLILDQEDTSESWISILSADDRTSWAENREALTQRSEANRETVEMLEASAFLVCLDDTEPQTAEERIRDMMMLEGFNRWVDKSVAFVVCKNATSGTYVEHTMIDAMTLTKMQTAIVEGIMTYAPPRGANDHSNGWHHLVQESTLDTTPELNARVLHVRERFKDEIAKFGYRDIILKDLGKDILMERRLPIKGIYDLMCLLANYYYYGYNAQSWEAISMSHYHKGRPDIVQVNTPLTAHFCTVADDESLPVKTRYELMLEAARNRNQTIKDAFTGQCYQRTLRALELCAEEGEELPALFKNPHYEQTVEPDQMFSNTDGLSPESCFIMQNPKKFWMTYYVTDTGSHFSVITGKQEVLEWANCLERASKVMKEIVLAV